MNKLISYNYTDHTVKEKKDSLVDATSAQNLAFLIYYYLCYLYLLLLFSFFYFVRTMLTYYFIIYLISILAQNIKIIQKPIEDWPT